MSPLGSAVTVVRHRLTPVAWVEAVNTGRIRPTRFGPLGRTGFVKRPVAGPVLIDPSGVAGDEIANPQFHGGPDRAVYAFAREDLAYWEAELGRPLGPGEFGENLTTVGLDIQHARIGERWRVGGCVVELTSVRSPCAVFAGQLGAGDWIRRFTSHGVPGVYLRVIEPGLVAAGDKITVVETRDHDFTVAYAFRAHTSQPDLLPALQAEPRVGGRLREKMLARLASR